MVEFLTTLILVTYIVTREVSLVNFKNYVGQGVNLIVNVLLLAHSKALSDFL